MKRHLLPVIACGLGLALAGCGQGDSKPSAGAGESAPAKSVVDSAADAAKSAADSAKTAVTEATAAVSKKVDEAVAQAQSFLSAGKFDNALGSLKSLADLKLTPEQQQTVSSLKAQIETAMTATKSAVGNAKTAATQATDVVATKVKEAVAQGQALLKEGKFQDALASLKGLSDLKLTADQTKLVDDLKAQIQTAMNAAKGAGTDASKAVSDLFKK